MYEPCCHCVTVSCLWLSWHYNTVWYTEGLARIHKATQWVIQRLTECSLRLTVEWGYKTTEEVYIVYKVVSITPQPRCCCRCCRCRRWHDVIYPAHRSFIDKWARHGTCQSGSYITTSTDNSYWACERRIRQATMSTPVI